MPFFIWLVGFLLISTGGIAVWLKVASISNEIRTVARSCDWSEDDREIRESLWQVRENWSQGLYALQITWVLWIIGPFVLMWLKII